MKIREVAEQCAVNIQTIRFYERRGLLRDPRSGVGPRPWAFTLQEVEELLALRVQSGTAADVKTRASDKLASVRAKIAGLRRLERALLQLVATCPGRGGLESYPILQGIERAVARPRKPPTSAHGRRRRRSR